MTTYFGSVATDRVDQDGERFSTEALRLLWEHAPDRPISNKFEGPEIGKVLSSALRDDGVVEVLASGALQPGLYVVPQFAYDPKDVTEEDGVKVYHKIKLMGFGLTTDPADTHLTPLKVEIE